MRDEATGRRLSRLSTIQREIVSKRCKAIDIDWVFYCDVCPTFLCLIEETRDDIRGKAHWVTERVARALNIPGFVVQDVEIGWKVRRIIPFDKTVYEYTDEQMADFLMGLRDTHNSLCSVHRIRRWEQEKAENGGSPWRPLPQKN